MKLKENMCPVCITTMALVVAGATTSSGLTVLTVKKISRKNGAKKLIPQSKSEDISL